MIKCKAVSLNSKLMEWMKRKLRLSDPWYQLIVRIIEPILTKLKGQTVIEVGCGLGGFCIYSSNKGINSVGVDISKSAIKEAAQLSKQECEFQKLIHFIVADACFLPIKNECANLVVCSETLEHIKDNKIAFSELVRIVKKSWYLCVTIPNIFSTLIFEYLYFLLFGQPRSVKKFINVEKEEIFHLPKLKKLINRTEMRIIAIKGTDFMHLHPRIKRLIPYVSILSNLLERKGNKIAFFGAHIGVLLRKGNAGKG